MRRSAFFFLALIVAGSSCAPGNTPESNKSGTERSEALPVMPTQVDRKPRQRIELDSQRASCFEVLNFEIGHAECRFHHRGVGQHECGPAWRNQLTNVDRTLQQQTLYRRAQQRVISRNRRGGLRSLIEARYP